MRGETGGGGATWYKDILVKGGRENGLSEAYVRDVLEALET